jgi:hypothetical protein
MLHVTILRKLATASLLLAGTLWSFSAFGDCACHFKDPAWEAYGTKAACATAMHKSETSCDVEFGGLDANPKLIAKIVNPDTAAYFAQVYAVLQLYLEALQKRDIQTLTSPDLLNRALPIFLRGASMQGSADDSAFVTDASNLDRAFVEFVSKYSEAIGKTFRGEIEPFTQVIADIPFNVGKGWISIHYKQETLMTQYLPEQGP